MTGGIMVFEDVKAEVGEWMEANGHISSAADLYYRLYSGRQLRGDMGQVYRALAQLANEGVLLRDAVVRGERADANWRTPAWDKQQQARRQVEAEAAQDLREAWAAVAARIRQLGIEPAEAGPVIRLDLDSWAQLLEYAERGYV